MEREGIKSVDTIALILKQKVITVSLFLCFCPLFPSIMSTPFFFPSHFPTPIFFPFSFYIIDPSLFLLFFKTQNNPSSLHFLSSSSPDSVSGAFPYSKIPDLGSSNF